MRRPEADSWVAPTVSFLLSYSFCIFSKSKCISKPVRDAAAKPRGCAGVRARACSPLLLWACCFVFQGSSHRLTLATNFSFGTRH